MLGGDHVPHPRLPDGYVAVADLQAALKSCLGEDYGIHAYVGDDRQACRKCTHSQSFILHLKSLLALLARE